MSASVSCGPGLEERREVEPRRGLPYAPRSIEADHLAVDTDLGTSRPRRCRSTALPGPAGEHETSSRTRPRRSRRSESHLSHRGRQISTRRLESTRGSTSTHRRTATRSRSHRPGSPPHEADELGRPELGRRRPYVRIVAVHGPGVPPNRYVAAPGRRASRSRAPGLTARRRRSGRCWRLPRYVAVQFQVPPLAVRDAGSRSWCRAPPIQCARPPRHASDARARRVRRGSKSRNSTSSRSG